MELNEIIENFFNLENISLEYNVNDYGLGELKSFENDICKYTSQMLYYTIKSISSCQIIEKGLTPLEEPVAFVDFKNNLLKIQAAAKKAQKDVINVSEQIFETTNNKLKSSGFIVARYKALEGLIDIVIPYYNLMQKIAKIRDSEQNKRLYLVATENLNKKVVKQLREIVSYAHKQGDWAIGQVDQLLMITSVFGTITSDFSAKNLLPEEEKQQPNNTRKIVLSGMSEGEKIRLKAISDANSLYDELCLDFMRDLEKQYAWSSKDLYEKFLQKFEKFTTRFKMPLSNDVSFGYACECIMQIRKLMDMVSEISENSYNIVAYGK